MVVAVDGFGGGGAGALALGPSHNNNIIPW